MCIKNTEKKLHIAAKRKIKIFFFLFISNSTYGKNISDNEHHLIFRIRYSNSWVRILLYVFGIRFIFKKRIIRYSVFIKFSKTNIFGIWYLVHIHYSLLIQAIYVLLSTFIGRELDIVWTVLTEIWSYTVFT